MYEAYNSLSKLKNLMTKMQNKPVFFFCLLRVVSGFNVGNLESGIDWPRVPESEVSGRSVDCFVVDLESTSK